MHAITVQATTRKQIHITKINSKWHKKHNMQRIKITTLTKFEIKKRYIDEQQPNSHSNPTKHQISNQTLNIKNQAIMQPLSKLR